MDWTEEKMDLLKSLWKQGKSASEIAAILGEEVSRNAIIGKAHRLGLAGRPSPIKKKEQKQTTLYGLTERMCKWPIGDPKQPDFHFCGKAVEVTVTYCPEHRAKAYTVSKKSLAVAK